MENPDTGDIGHKTRNEGTQNKNAPQKTKGWTTGSTTTKKPGVNPGLWTIPMAMKEYCSDQLLYCST